MAYTADNIFGVHFIAAGDEYKLKEIMGEGKDAVHLYKKNKNGWENLGGYPLHIALKGLNNTTSSWKILNPIPQVNNSYSLI
jgi:hypothetical protein